MEWADFTPHILAARLLMDMAVASGKKSPPNKQFIPHHLSRGKKSRRTQKILAKLNFFLVKAKIIFFRFGLLVSFLLLLRLLDEWWKFQRICLSCE